MNSGGALLAKPCRRSPFPSNGVFGRSQCACDSTRYFIASCTPGRSRRSSWVLARELTRSRLTTAAIVPIIRDTASIRPEDEAVPSAGSTSLADTAWPAVAGTLRYCVEDPPGPRFVIFETSGTIKLAQGPLFVENPYITIAGQTAPSPGILIRGPGLIIDTHDVVVQHVRVRVGSIGANRQRSGVRDDATRVVIDHVSVSWSIWTALSCRRLHARASAG